MSVLSYGKDQAIRQILLNYANNDSATTTGSLDAILGVLGYEADLQSQRTLRDEFAMAALNSLISSPIPAECRQLSPDEVRAHISGLSYLWADAMLSARKL